MNKEKIQQLLCKGDYIALQEDLNNVKFHELVFKTEQEKRFANIILSKIDPADDALLFASARFGASIERTGNFKHIKVTELYSKIASCLELILKEKGFKYHKSQKCFLRQTPLGQDSIRFFKTSSAFYNINISFGKRIDTINKISAKVVKATEINLSEDFETYDTIWFTANDVNQDITAITSNYFAHQLLSLMRFIENEVLTLFDKHESLTVLNQIYNYEAFKNEDKLDSTNHFLQFIKDPKHIISRINGLICARLENETNYEHFYKKYLDIFAQNNYAFDELNYKAIEYTNHYLDTHI